MAKRKSPGDRPLPHQEERSNAGGSILLARRRRADGTPLDGIGWVILEGGKLTGTICIHLGDELEFVAKRAKAPKTIKRLWRE